MDNYLSLLISTVSHSLGIFLPFFADGGGGGGGGKIHSSIVHTRLSSGNLNLKSNSSIFVVSNVFSLASVDRENKLKMCVGYLYYLLLKNKATKFWHQNDSI